MGQGSIFYCTSNSYSESVNAIETKKGQHSADNMSAKGCRRLEGKVAIVTASSTGIGYGIAERLAQEGAKVVISSRNKQNVDEAVSKIRSQGLEAFGVVCHVGKREDRENLLAQTLKVYGGIDILVPNAAVSTAFGPVLNTTEQQYDKMLDINVKSQFFLIKETVPHMEERGGGCIIVVSSVGAYNPGNAIGIYGMTKTALQGMTKALVPQLTALNIRINNIAPGLIQTNFSKALWQKEKDLKERLQFVPMNRMGQPQEIGSAAAFLASEDASYITGETIIVGGGQNHRL